MIKTYQGKDRLWQVGDIIRPSWEGSFVDHIIMQFHEESGVLWVRVVRPYAYVSEYARTPLLGFEDYTMAASTLDRWKFLHNHAPR